jgi:hypothetical protein
MEEISSVWDSIAADGSSKVSRGTDEISAVEVLEKSCGVTEVKPPIPYEVRDGATDGTAATGGLGGIVMGACGEPIAPGGGSGSRTPSNSSRAENYG